MDARLFSAIMAASVSAMGVGLQAVRVLANNGFIPPEDVDTIAHGINAPFDEMGGDEISERIRAIFDASLSGALADIHRAAQANWKG